ncbi:hypothetical protein NPX13_g7595 [Xylaria arbuscula]|uniref:Uncharacterized protein n=1 Tax=Xylaria arbuscula TaxID=114810 RepID=A0A9W8NA68_9PEZI|nr:hypothetical protein NPX13_g7595 [Xylaria arbuscula]
MERLFDYADAIIRAEQENQPTEVLTAAMFDAINSLVWEHYDGQELVELAMKPKIDRKEYICMRFVVNQADDELRLPGAVDNIYGTIKQKFSTLLGWKQSLRKPVPTTSSMGPRSGPFSEILKDLGLTRRELQLRAETEHGVRRQRLATGEENHVEFYNWMRPHRRKRVEDPLSSLRIRRTKRHRGAYRVDYDESSSDEGSTSLEGLITSDVETPYVWFEKVDAPLVKRARDDEEIDEDREFINDEDDSNESVLLDEEWDKIGDEEDTTSQASSEDDPNFMAVAEPWSMEVDMNLECGIDYHDA